MFSMRELITIERKYCICIVIYAFLSLNVDDVRNGIVVQFGSDQSRSGALPGMRL